MIKDKVFVTRNYIPLNYIKNFMKISIIIKINLFIEIFQKIDTGYTETYRLGSRLAFIKEVLELLEQNENVKTAMMSLKNLVKKSR